MVRVLEKHDIGGFMMHYVKAIIWIFIIQTTLIFNTNAGKIDRFYLSPGYTNLNAIFKEYQSYPEINDHTKDMLSVFTVNVLKEHPEYTNSLIKNFPQFSEFQKEIVGKALYYIKGNAVWDLLNLHDSIFKNLVISFKYPEVLTIESPVKTEEDLIPKANNTDFIWMSFYATGKPEYLIQILKFLANEDLFVKTAGHEILNRDMIQKGLTKATVKEAPFDIKDIMKVLKANDPTGKKHLELRAISYYAILKSMEGNANQYKHIAKIVAKLIKNDPSLDYAKDVRL